MKPDEGLRAVGANWVERVWFGIVPQVMPNFLSATRCCASRSMSAPRPSSARSAAAASAKRCACRSAAATRPRRWPSSSCCSSPSSPSTSFRPGCASALVGDQAFSFGAGHVMTKIALTADESTVAERAIPTSSAGPFCKRFGRPGRRVVGAVYFVSAWWIFSIGAVLARRNWDIAGAYLADWVCYEARPDIEYRRTTISMSPSRAFPRSATIPHPDWLTKTSKTVDARSSSIRSRRPRQRAIRYRQLHRSRATPGTSPAEPARSGCRVSWARRQSAPAGGAPSRNAPRRNPKTVTRSRRDRGRRHDRAAASIRVVPGLVTVIYRGSGR